MTVTTDFPFGTTGKLPDGSTVNVSGTVSVSAPAVTPPPPPPSGVKCGVSFETIAKFDSKSSATSYGPMKIAQCYYDAAESPPGDVVWGSSDQRIGRAGHAIPHGDLIVTFTIAPNLVTAATNTALQTALTGFWHAAPNGPHRIYWVYNLEADAKIAQGLYTLAQYIDAWDVILGWFKAANPNPYLIPTVKLTGEASNARPNPWQAYLPKSGIGCVGWDVYPPNGQGFAAPSTWLDRIVTAVQSPATAAYVTGTGKRLMHGIAEFGSVGVKTASGWDVSGRPAWLTAVGDFVKAQSAPIEFCLNYDSAYPGGLGGGGSFQIDGTTDTASLAAWRGVIAG